MPALAPAEEGSHIRQAVAEAMKEPGAWFKYDDEGCEADCLAAEYFYWGLTSLLGAQKDRCEDIEHEWKLCNSDKLKAGDPTLYQLLINDTYDHTLPTILPDG